jgi:hypothetical protein
MKKTLFAVACLGSALLCRALPLQAQDKELGIPAETNSTANLPKKHWLVIGTKFGVVQIPQSSLEICQVNADKFIKGLRGGWIWECLPE